MISATILNAVLALGVIVMVVAPLVWAITTQHRDHRRTVATDTAAPRPRGTVERQRDRRTRYEPVAGRA